MDHDSLSAGAAPFTEYFTFTDGIPVAYTQFSKNVSMTEACVLGGRYSFASDRRSSVVTFRN